jgi:ferrous iron transport protein B
VIAGVGGVLIFLPQILILFFFIGVLEGSGYMARAAFIMDRLMSKVGLNGKAFVPLLSSYACAIPGIMAARTLENPRQRLIVILVAPFQSCSARLPVYLLLIAALFPSEEVPALAKAGLMFGLYTMGTAAAFGFAGLFSRVLPHRSAPPPFLLELPAYQMPNWRDVFRRSLVAGGIFLRKAGTVILGLSILLWALATYPRSDDPSPSVRLEKSAIGQFGHFIEPAVRPLGWDWKIGASVATSFAAREVFVGTLSILYSVDAEEGEIDTTPLGTRLLALVTPEKEVHADDTKLLRNRLQEARWPDGSPIFSFATCASLLVFFVFAMQCMATLVMTWKETESWKWALFQLGYQTSFALFLAFSVYQIFG